jgi:tyrosinase
MPAINRRAFVSLTAAIPLAAWLEQRSWAQPRKNYVRYDARSPQGKAMLKTYAGAVAKMKAGDQGSPLHWTFQWYTHWVKGPQRPVSAVRQKRIDELNRIYGANPSPNRNLATEMWDNCEAHGSGIIPSGAPDFPPQVENYFLPWHRMFVYFFERIIRSVSGDENFSLPYWNYSTNDMAIRGVIPPEFIMSNDPIFQSLFIPNRNPWINQGNPIRGNLTPGNPNDPLTLSSLKQANYQPTSSTVRGFCETLDFGLHGNVHVGVGDGTDMGSVPTAAGDPIFWLHHCNIDRLWASWNAAGRTNPNLTQTFVFADERGQRVVGNISDFLNMANHDYTYDRLEPVPPPARHVTAALVADQVPKVRAARRQIALAAQPTRAALETTADALDAQPKSFATHVESLGEAGRIYLVIRDLQTDLPPGVLYNLYLDLPQGADAEQSKGHEVGVINFFHAHPHSQNGGGHDAPGAADSSHANTVTFDITDVVRALQKSNQLSPKPELTVAPVGEPAADAKPVIGEASIIEV